MVSFALPSPASAAPRPTARFAAGAASVAGADSGRAPPVPRAARAGPRRHRARRRFRPRRLGRSGDCCRALSLVLHRCRFRPCAAQPGDPYRDRLAATAAGADSGRAPPPRRVRSGTGADSGPAPARPPRPLQLPLPRWPRASRPARSRLTAPRLLRLRAPNPAARRLAQRRLRAGADSGRAPADPAAVAVRRSRCPRPQRRHRTDADLSLQISGVKR